LGRAPQDTDSRSRPVVAANAGERCLASVRYPSSTSPAGEPTCVTAGVDHEHPVIESPGSHRPGRVARLTVANQQATVTVRTHSYAGCGQSCNRLIACCGVPSRSREDCRGLTGQHTATAQTGVETL